MSNRFDFHCITAFKFPEWFHEKYAEGLSFTQGTSYDSFVTVHGFSEIDGIIEDLKSLSCETKHEYRLIGALETGELFICSVDSNICKIWAPLEMREVDCSTGIKNGLEAGMFL